ncbi:MAG: UDP-N-acetylglucosamine--N-acetylmuramyl-(pentapeptide) pyrophosphoryl-undecaprenol N-acetylglucosamine transferase [bacterium]|nr:UDP-N-acetylglucosamine--N-acetylmuramyl-(pentapeptide) pyrophosphoryl-undecaprenol N-acetylglucosamine transferase [bacterium]
MTKIRKGTVSVGIAAGGTGGHIMPAVSVAQALKKLARDRGENIEVFFIGTGRQLERELVAAAALDYEFVPVEPVVGRGIIGLLLFIIGLPIAVWRCLKIFRRRNVRAVIGFGGFPSFVPLFTAWIRRLPAVLQEQNVKVGLANKVLSLFVERIFAPCGAYGFFRSSHLIEMMNPVREEFYHLPPPTDNSPDKSLSLLVIGGSQGALRVNQAITNLLPWFKSKGVRLIHQTGKLDYERTAAVYRENSFTESEVFAFTKTMPECIGRADIVISRAGAMSAAEITASGRGAIYIPLAIARGHQKENVIKLAEAGAARIIDQDDRLEDNLKRTLEELLDNRHLVQEMADNARSCYGSGGRHPAQVMADYLLERLT